MRNQIQRLFEEIFQVREEMNQMRQTFQKRYEDELLQSSKKETVPEALSKLGVDKVSEIKAQYQELLDRNSESLKQKLKELEKSFEALSQDYQFPKDNGDSWEIYASSHTFTYATQGLGADSYARNALCTAKAHCEAWGLETKTTFDKEAGAYRLWIKGDEVDVAILKNKPEMSLAETVQALWKSGVNPRVIFPLLPWGFEEKHGISFT